MINRPKVIKSARISPHAIQLLSAQLDRFATSTRFLMLEHLLVGAFAKKDAKLPKVLLGSTFGDLVRNGAEATCQTKGVNAQHIKRLIEIVNSLLDGENSSETPHIPSAVKPDPTPLRRKRAPLPAPRVSSVEAEQRLTRALAKLRAHPRFQAIALNLVGDYWDPEWVRAPFEEALTFEQLSQLKPRALLEKRSFTPQKLLHLVSAVDRVFGAENRPAVALEAPLSVPTTPPLAPSSLPRQTAQLHGWRSDVASLPAPLSAAILQFEQEVASCADSASQAVTDLLEKIPSAINSREYLTAMLLEEYEPRLVSSMLKIDHESVIETSKVAYRKLEQCLRETSKALHHALTAALLQPAVAVSTLEEILFGAALSDKFRATLAALFARSLGGAPVEVFGTRPPGYWSKNTMGLDRAVRLLVGGLPKSDSEVRADALAILPGLPFEVTAELLKQLAFYKEKERSWVKKALS